MVCAGGLPVRRCIDMCFWAGQQRGLSAWSARSITLRFNGLLQAVSWPAHVTSSASTELPSPAVYMVIVPAHLFPAHPVQTLSHLQHTGAALHRSCFPVASTYPGTGAHVAHRTGCTLHGDVLAHSAQGSPPHPNMGGSIGSWTYLRNRWQTNEYSAQILFKKHGHTQKQRPKH